MRISDWSSDVCSSDLSFSRAAEALGVSPSALSQLVRGFEGRVGVRLLQRTTRSVALTEAGEMLFRRVRPAVSELGDAIGQVRRTRNRPAGTLRVHVFRSAADSFLEPMLPAFMAAYPEVVQIGRASCRERVCQYV